ncbi:MAG: arsenate reductase (glutaredoxin) [Neisseriaceae bacterium]|nr:arsenate reductase (glutaredoxin) [Neisseriaceae bacterium]MBP6863076.1 arsenate reductase (glutaredoxin) [Neisseriaceae bacterium]
MAITLFHNPRCSKSREALAALQDLGHTPEVVLYLETPPDAATLTAMLAKLGLPARSLLRTKEAEYAELGLADAGLSDAQLIAAMVSHPKLIERPIAIVGERAAVGRPLDNILALLA